MGAIDIYGMVTALRAVAAVLTAVTLLCWAQVGPGLLAVGLFAVTAGMFVKVDGASAVSLDAAVEAWLERHRSPGLVADASALHAALGDPAPVAIFAGMCGLVLSLRARSAMPAVVLMAAPGIGVLLEQAIKALHAGHSFPSGHAMGATTLLGLIAVCLGTRQSPAVKAMLVIPVSVGVAFVSGLAMYCGAHTLTDVLGGMVLGAAIVASGAAVLEAFGKPRRRRPVNDADAPTVATTAERPRRPVNVA